MTKLRIFYYLVNFEDFYVTLVPVSDVAKQDNDDNDEARKKTKKVSFTSVPPP